jgi:hypothetical protein
MKGKLPSDDLKTTILKGVNRSSILGLLGNPLFRIVDDIHRTSNAKNTWKQPWYNEPIDYLLGPNSSILNPAYDAMMEAVSGKSVDEKTAYKLKKLIPFSNLWFLSPFNKTKPSSGGGFGKGHFQ